jgi:large conductance mechanosensitive channel
MGFVQEFKDFAMRGNVVDMAVGIIIGSAFGKIVGSLVSDIIMPPIGMLIGGVDFKDLALTLRDAGVDEAGIEIAAVTIGYGSFINQVLDFVIIAFAIFMMIRFMSSLKRKEPAPAPPPPEVSAEQKLLGEIRDLLAAKK